jgi:hypothetical protein
MANKNRKIYPINPPQASHAHELGQKQKPETRRSDTTVGQQKLSTVDSGKTPLRIRLRLLQLDVHVRMLVVRHLVQCSPCTLLGLLLLVLVCEDRNYVELAPPSAWFFFRLRFHHLAHRMWVVLPVHTHTWWKDDMEVLASFSPPGMKGIEAAMYTVRFHHCRPHSLLYISREWVRGTTLMSRFPKP